MSTSPVVDPDLMQCMEVRGGHGEAANFFRRPGLDVWIWSQSRRATELEGGDMHYISSCASGRITRMLMADVGGIDNLFSNVAIRMREVMKKNINVIAQNSAVQQLSEHMQCTSEQGGFASTLLSTFFAPTRSFTVCNAGHPPPLCYYAAIDQWKFLKPESKVPATGVEQESTGTLSADDFQKFKLTLDFGDMVLSFSNALPECRRRDGSTLGLLGLQEFARRLNDQPLDEHVLDRWISDIRAEHPDNLRGDDATIILSKVTRSRVPMRDNLLALVRVFGKPMDKTTF
ncbi:MAG: PP2C family protein-serine/threonine phosphatase [Pirellulaceae bacterium]